MLRLIASAQQNCQNKTFDDSNGERDTGIVGGGGGAGSPDILDSASKQDELDAKDSAGFHQVLWGQPDVEQLSTRLLPAVVFVRERPLLKTTLDPADVIAEIRAFVKLVSGAEVRVPVVVITDDYDLARLYATLPEFKDYQMPYVFGATKQRKEGIPKKITMMALLADASDPYQHTSLMLDVEQTEFFHRVEYMSCMTTPYLDASLVHAYDLMLRFAQADEDGLGLPLVVWEWNMGIADAKLNVDLAIAAKALGHSYVSLNNGKGHAKTPQHKRRARMEHLEAEFNACMDVCTQVVSMHADNTFTYLHECLMRMHVTKHIPDLAVPYMSGTVGYEAEMISRYEAGEDVVEVKKHHVLDGNGVFAKKAIKKNDTVCIYYGTVKLNASSTPDVAPDGYVLDLPNKGNMFVMEMSDCTAKNINSNLGAKFNVGFSKSDDLDKFSIEIVALRPISKGEELNIDYGSCFDWSNRERKSWLPRGELFIIDPAALSSSTSSSGSSSTGSSSSAVDSLSLSHCLTVSPPLKF
jgi:hypothetical protein